MAQRRTGGISSFVHPQTYVPSPALMMVIQHICLYTMFYYSHMAITAGTVNYVNAVTHVLARTFRQIGVHHASVKLSTPHSASTLIAANTPQYIEAVDRK